LGLAPVKLDEMNQKNPEKTTACFLLLGIFSLAININASFWKVIIKSSDGFQMSLKNYI
jgi:hypothetical protein